MVCWSFSQKVLHENPKLLKRPLSMSHIYEYGTWIEPTLIHLTDVLIGDPPVFSVPETLNSVNRPLFKREQSSDFVTGEIMLQKKIRKAVEVNIRPYLEFVLHEHRDTFSGDTLWVLNELKRDGSCQSLLNSFDHFSLNQSRDIAKELFADLVISNGGTLHQLADAIWNRILDFTNI